MSDCVVYGYISPYGGWDIANTLTLISIFVDVFIGGCIAFLVSRRLSSDREFRNYYIKEVCEEKQKHDVFWTRLEQANISPSEILAWFKQRNMSTSALMRSFKKRKKKISSVFEDYVREMRDFIDSIEWMQSQGNNLSHADINRITEFKRNHASIFHDVIAEING